MKQKALYLIIFLAAGIFIYSFWQDSIEEKAREKLAAQQAHQESVNRHLYGTSLSIKLQQERAELEQKLGTQNQPVPQAGQVEQASSDEDRMQDLMKKLNRGQRVADEQTVENEIQQELYNDQRVRDYNEAYRRAYIDQFIENARQAGYAIRVNYQTLKIESVRRIK